MKRLLIISIILMFLLSIFSSLLSDSSGIEKHVPDQETIIKISDEKQIKNDKEIVNHENDIILNSDPVNHIDFSNFFTANHGQVGNDEVKYYILGQGIWFTPTGVVFELVEQSKVKNSYFDKFEIPVRAPEDLERESEIRKSVVVTFNFVNSNNVLPTGEEELPHKTNFFYGNESDKWRINVPNYGEIVYENIYNNIDLRFYFNDKGLKYDFIVNPGGNPEDIIIQIDGANELSLNIDYNIVINTGLNEIIDKDLFVYQRSGRSIQKVNTRFNLINTNSYGFSILDDYDKKEVLIIDPLIYSTFLGGISEESVKDIALDENGNIYLTGWTESLNFPVINSSNDTTPNGLKDIFITKIDADATSLIYSTYIGGFYNETPYAIEIDPDGNTYITGNTESDNFPTTPGANDTTYNGGTEGLGDVFVCKLNAGGTILEYSTYIGGFTSDFAQDIILDDQKNAYITGVAYSFDFPTTPGAYDTDHALSSEGDVFITKMDKNGSRIIHSTFIGGLDHDSGYSITIDNANNICVTGFTWSEDFPSTPGVYDESFNGYDGFILKLNQNLSTLLSSTSIGTGIRFTKNNILVDNINNIYLTGSSASIFHPTTSNAYDTSHNGGSDIFISKLDSNLTTLLYSTFLGGKGNDWAWDSIFDEHGNIYVVGDTNSSDFPVLNGVYDTSYNGNTDVFIIKFNITNSMLMYSSFIGGSGDDIGYGITIDDEGYVYLAGQAGTGFPTTSGSFDPTFNGGNSDAFVLKLKLTSIISVHDLNISESIVYRPHVIELYSNASDFEDIERFLKPHFEYLTPGQPVWDDQLLTAPVYKNDRWEAVFSIPINASLGYYDFRVRFNDTDDIWTTWRYLNDSLRVLNNPPWIDNFNISRARAVIGERITLTAIGTDIEDESYQLKTSVEYKPSSSQFWDVLEYDKLEYIDPEWEYTFTISPEMEYGQYDLRVRVNDTDLDYSDWYYLNNSLQVLPAPPEVLSISLSKSVINRTEIVEVYVNCTDPDSVPDELVVELQYMPLIEDKWYDLSADYYGTFWESSLNSKKTWVLGKYNFRARVIDWEDNTSPWFYFNDSLTINNNLPELLNIDGISDQIYRGESIIISIDAKDKENPEEELLIEFEQKLFGEQDWTSGYLSSTYYLDNSWNYDFTLPVNAPIDHYSFRARVGDLDGDWSSYTYLNDSLTVINSIPAVVSFEQSPGEVYRTGKVMITADGTDFETAVEDLHCNIYYFETVNYKWTELETRYNITGGHWYAELVTTKTSVLGNYSFMVEFIDGDGVASKPVYANGTVWIRNNPPEISQELDDINVGKMQYILKLDEYGYDVETPKGDLIWVVELNSIDNSLFHIEDENIGNQEIVIYPVKNKRGSDDFTLILIDADGGKAIKRDITVIVDSKTGGGGTDTDGEDSTISKLTESNFIWVYLIIIIIAIILINLFIFNRRKKKVVDEEEQFSTGQDKAKSEEAVQLLISGETPTKDMTEVPVPVSVPAIEQPPEQAQVSMPAPLEPPPELPATTESSTGGAQEPEEVPSPSSAVAAPAAEPATAEPAVKKEPTKKEPEEAETETANED